MDSALPSQVQTMSDLRTSADVEALLVAQRPWLFRLAQAIVGSRDGAEDAAQEALFRATRSRARLAQVDDPRAWLRRVLVRCALDILAARPLVELGEGPGARATLEGDVAVRHALSRLAPKDRALLALAHMEGLSYAELSDTLGIPSGTVGSRLHAAREAFRKEWGDV